MPAKWTTANIPPQTNRRVLITGANSGIGFHTALELARAGAEIILPTRSAAKAADAMARIRAEVPNASLIPETLDLADLTSVRAFAARIAARFPGPSLDLHINNAGVMALPTRELLEEEGALLRFLAQQVTARVRRSDDPAVIGARSGLVAVDQC